jgi:hypothetical protein
MVGGAADKAAVQPVQVRPCQLLVTDTSRCHSLGQVTNRAMRGLNGLATRHEGDAVGATWGSSESGSLNMSE